MLMQKAIELYLESCLTLSPRTVMWYKRVLKLFADQCPQLPSHPEPIERFLSSVKQRDCSDETLKDYFSVLRTFYNFCEKRYHESNPIGYIRIPHPKRKLVRPLDMPEQQMLLSIGKNDRDRAILTLFLDSMIRVGELVSLRRTHLSGNTIYIQGKTGNRTVPILDSTARLLSRIGQGEYFFIGPKGPLTTGGIHKVVKKYLKMLGIKRKRMGPHLLRHSAATQYIVNGGNPLILQKVFLGHETLDMTSAYVHLAETKVAAEQHERLSPIRSATENGHHRCPKCDQLVFREKYEEGDRLVCICGWSGYLNGGQ